MELCAKIASKWRSICIQLGVPDHELDSIQANNRGDPHMVRNCLSRMFNWWLKNERDVTPGKLAQAIHIVGEHELEVGIKKKNFVGMRHSFYVTTYLNMLMHLSI